MGSPKPIRLAILMADTPLPGTQAKYQTYGGVFTDLFSRATSPDPVSAHLTITTHDVVSDPSSYPSLDAIDAILITGSRYNSFDSDPWIVRLVEYVRSALADGKVKVVGVCFGHQIVGRVLGVPVDRSLGGWEVSVTDVELTEQGKAFFGLETMASFLSISCSRSPARLLLTVLARKSTRCTGTLSFPTRPTPSRWRRRPLVPCRGCCSPAGQ